MEKVQELRMTLIILLCGLFFISGCFFSSKHTISFKTNGGNEIENVIVKSGNKIEEPKIPEKDGYSFVGWYVDGKEFDFDTKVKEDITLVAKWKKVEVIGENTDDPNEEITDSTITSQIQTTRPLIGDTTHAITKRTVVYKTTKKTTKHPTTTTTSTTTTTTHTTQEILKPSVPTTKTSTVPTTKKKYMYIKLEENNTPIEEKTETTEVTSESTTEPTTPTTEKVESTETIPKKKTLNIYFDRDELTSNVVSYVDQQDLKLLMESDKTKWEILDNNKVNYTEELMIYEKEVLKLTSSEEIEWLSVYDGNNNFIIKHEKDKDAWTITYPTVTIGSGARLKYYSDIKTALSYAEPKDSITLLEEQEVNEALDIKVPITLNGNNYQIKTSSEYLFQVETMNFEEDEIVIKNLKSEVCSFINFQDNINIKNILLDSLNIVYKENIYHNEQTLSIELLNTNFNQKTL